IHHALVPPVWLLTDNASTHPRLGASPMFMDGSTPKTLTYSYGTSHPFTAFTRKMRFPPSFLPFSSRQVKPIFTCRKMRQVCDSCHTPANEPIFTCRKMRHICDR